MRFIYNNQVFMVDNTNQCFQIFDLSINTFDSQPIKQIEYKKTPPALKKFINQNRIYLYGDLFKQNMIQLRSPTQTTFQQFIFKDYELFVDKQPWFVQRKIDGFHVFIYFLDKPLSFEELINVKDDTFFENETILEGEYTTNNKYYVFTTIREKSESRLELSVKDNFELAKKIVKQQLTIDFKIKGKDKQLNVFVLDHLEIKLPTIEEWIEKFKTLLSAQTSSTIETDGFVFYKVDQTISDRCMYKIKPTNNTSCEFLLKWDEPKQQYTLTTVGTFKDFQLTNSGTYIKSEKQTPNAKLGGYEFDFKLPFYLNTMSHIYKPKLDDPLGEIALKGELDGKFCECAWHQYNDSDPYFSRVVPQKIRYEVSKISQISTAISCYTGSLVSFTNYTPQDIKDTQLFNTAPENYIDFFMGATIPQQDKPTMFVYQANCKNFLGGIKDITNYRFVYILQNSLSLQILTFDYIRKQLLETQAQQDKKLSRFPNWYMTQQQKLQQMIVKQNVKFDILRIEDNFEDILNDITQINVFDIIAQSSQEIQIIDSKHIIPGSQFEKHLQEFYVQQNNSRYPSQISHYTKEDNLQIYLTKKMHAKKGGHRKQKKTTQTHHKTKPSHANKTSHENKPTHANKSKHMNKSQHTNKLKHVDNENDIINIII